MVSVLLNCTEIRPLCYLLVFRLFSRRNDEHFVCGSDISRPLCSCDGAFKCSPKGILKDTSPLKPSFKTHVE